MSKYIDEITKQALKKLGTKAYYGSNRNSNIARDRRNALSGVATSSVTGAMPKLTDFARVSGGNRVGTRWTGMQGSEGIYNESTLDIDNDAYAGAMFDWMRKNDRYKDWSDDEIRGVAGGSAGKSPEGVNAYLFAEEQGRNFRQARDEAKADRDDILSEIAAFDAQYNDAWVSQQLATEGAMWDARISENLRRVEERYAAMGKVPHPAVLADIHGRLINQKESAMQITQMNLEQQKADYKRSVISMKDRVYSNTDRQVMSPGQVLQAMKAVGDAAGNKE
jgi:hypothetical protein